MSDLNVNVGSQGPQTFTTVQGSEPVTTPNVPNTTLGPMDSSSLAEQNQEVPATLYAAPSGTPAIPIPVITGLSPHTYVSSASIDASISTLEAENIIAAGSQSVDVQAEDPSASDTPPVTDYVVLRREQQQDQEGGSGGGQKDDQQNESFRREFDIPVNPDGVNTDTETPPPPPDSEEIIDSNQGPDLPPGTEIDPITGEIITIDPNFNPGTPFTAPIITGVGLTTTISGANAVDPSGYVDNPSNFKELVGNFLYQAQEIVDDMLTQLSLVPDSPEKQNMIDYLNAISRAIMDIQTMLQQIQGFDSEAEKAQCQAQLDTSLANIQQQLDAIGEEKKNLEKQQKKEKALAKIGLTTAALNIIIMVVMVLIALPAIIAAGPVGGSFIAAFIIVIMVDMIMKASGDEKGVFTRTMDAVGDLTRMAMEADGGYSQSEIDGACLGVKMAVTAIVISALIAASPSCALLVCSSGISSMISACKIGSEIARLSGGDAKAQMIAELCVQGAAMIVMAVNSFGTGGLAVADDAIKVTNEIIMSAFKTAQKCAQFMSRTGVQLTYECANAAATVVLATGNAVVNYKLNELKSALSEIEASSDSESEVKQALIKVLKDLIQKLQEAISGMSEFIGSLNTMQINMYQNLSNSLPM